MADRHLRALTVSPLLCALVCALNRERRTQLPRDRMEIYEAALDMLLERRDRERGVELAATAPDPDREAPDLAGHRVLAYPQRLVRRARRPCCRSGRQVAAAPAQGQR